MFIFLTVIARDFSDVKHNLADGIFEKTIIPVSNVGRVAQGSTGGHSDEFREVTRVYTTDGYTLYVGESFDEIAEILTPGVRSSATFGN